ncbi:alpha/beta hydrolase [Pseudonocardia nematodicida]|uniref:Alpha/beta hydrolase n=1 Tax=Pseudonocardia nematodicida TaxID=1206997 RepID=A0ABV1KAE9_9PSEU
MIREHVVERPEGLLHAHLAGDTGPPVVLLSGAGLDNAMLSWSRLIPDLARDHRVIALDWPKQGRSRPWDGRATHQILLRSISDVLDDLGVEKAAVVGLSQGGAMTLAYAIEHPERVERLVALAPGGTLSFPPFVHQLLWLMAKVRLLHDTLPNLVFRNRSMTAAFVRRALFGDASQVDDLDAIVDAVLAEARSGNAGSSDWQNDSIGFRRMRIDLRPRLHEIRCPALFVQGDRDAGVPVARTAEAARLVPGARLEVLPGRGHWSNRESPDEVNALIRKFLTGDH